MVEWSDGYAPREVFGPGRQPIYFPADDLLKNADFQRRMVEVFQPSWDNQPRVEIIGWWNDGDDVVVRWRASVATTHVVVQIQHTGAGGGGETYDPATQVSRDRIDCRENRQQDTTVSRTTDDEYSIWLIPSFLEGDGTTYTDYDGEGITQDLMAMMAVGSRL